MRLSSLAHRFPGDLAEVENLRGLVDPDDPSTLYRYLHENSGVLAVRKGRIVFVGSHELITQVTSQPEVYGATVGSKDALVSMARSLSAKQKLDELRKDMIPVTARMTTDDKAKHSLYRKVLASGLNQENIDRAAGKLDIFSATRLGTLSEIDPGTPVDLVAQFVKPFVGTMMAELMGFDPELCDELYTVGEMVAIEGHSYMLDFDELVDVVKYIERFHRLALGAMPDARPGSILRVAHDQPELSDAEKVGLVRALMIGGVVAPAAAMSFAIYEILRGAALPPPENFPAFFEECLRFHSPVQALMRKARVDTQLAGMMLEKGTLVILLLPAANHDPTRYRGADEFDPFAQRLAHIAFGFGSHYCPGSGAARSLLPVGVKAVAEAGFLEPDRTQALCVTGGLTIRTPREVRALVGASHRPPCRQ